MEENSVKRNLLSIRNRIEKSCKLYERKASEVNLVAVSKKVSVEKILQAIECGVKIFGENYAQEAREKWTEIKKKFPEIKLHLVGHLQSNKASEAVGLFDCIETIDSKKLASAIAKEAKKQQKNPEIFIQVNVGEEVQKGGVALSELSELVKFSRECGLNITGLMCVPPANEAASPYFALLTKLAHTHGLQKISMGMSADFEDALALGTTHVRIGTAIFGERP